MSIVVDLVADIGEGFGQYRMGDDQAILPLLSSANVACGFHAGDPRIMSATAQYCRDLGVRMGAHPSFPDLVGFGRRAIEATAAEVETDVLYQLGALSAFARASGIELQHVAPHGRLGNLVVTDQMMADAVADAVLRFDPQLIVVSQPGALLAAARTRGLRSATLGLADRAYHDDGTLVSRREPGAVLHDEDEIAERVVRMVTEAVIQSVSGADIPIHCDSVLLHGDNAGAVSFARRIRDELSRAGVTIKALAEFIPTRAVASSGSR